jgi:hypothetical protein
MFAGPEVNRFMQWTFMAVNNTELSTLPPMPQVSRERSYPELPLTFFVDPAG